MGITNEEREALKRELLAEIKREEEAERLRLETLKKQAELKARQDFLLEQEARAKAEAELKASEEPWVDIKGIVKDPKHGIKIELDWNDAFVKYLKESGLEGPSDDVIVQRWLEAVSAQVSTDMAIAEAERSITDGSEFE